MNTMLLNRHVLAGGLLVLLTLLSHPSRAEGRTALLEKAQACAEESSRLERLNCYDALFKTPTPSGDTSELPALWHAIEHQEAARSGDDMGLAIRETGNDVLISVPALGTTPPRPIMVMACEKLITRFQLHMPVAIDSARVTLELTGHGGVIEQQWRVRDGGQVISGGRGLPAIDTLRQLLSAEELTLRSDESALDGLRFDVSGLREDIQPLRDACRW
ncbi:type VI secretion system-associated protein TagO [Halomonas sp. SH5A2]|uniref:type VI secretion system-associated protein VasI n=1 Tax=Halomonas sp. SH5A2 TaxID=2749040 RepID=UPI001640EB2E|nr:type VI secretion system-associated protein VasI [Halomonas sp. SH5A2]QNI01812.1 type VI secretion system-associated protein TagO [Halomonas sp. SH5A2]